MARFDGVSSRPAAAAALVSALLLVAAGLIFSGVHAVNGDAGGPEGWLQHLSFGLPLAAAGVVSLMGLSARQPLLVLAGGAAAMPMAIVSIIGLPAVVCGVILIAAGARGWARASTREVIESVCVVVLLVGSFFYEVLHQDAREWATPDGSAGSSNVITATESLVVFAAVGLALALAMALSRANDRTIRPVQSVGG